MQASEAYAWLAANPVGAYVVVENLLADHIMLTQGGMIYKDDLWHAIKHERLSTGTVALCLVMTPYKDRTGAGPFVSLSNADPNLVSDLLEKRAGDIAV